MDDPRTLGDADLDTALTALRDGRATGVAAADSLPAVPGAYLLAIRLAAACRPDIASLRARDLAPGWYLYAGSARGPGGIRARVGRHLRRAGRRHWHVDRLTAAAAELRVLPVPGGRECALVAALLARPGVETALTGFGSSDCRRCAGHLLAVGAGAGALESRRPRP